MPRTDGPPFDRRFLPRITTPFGVKPRGLSIARGLGISFDAVTILARDDIEVGHVLELELLLPREPEPFSVCGRVIEEITHRGQPALRIRLESMSPAGRQRIAAWMARHRRAA